MIVFKPRRTTSAAVIFGSGFLSSVIYMKNFVIHKLRDNYIGIDFSHQNLTSVYIQTFQQFKLAVLTTVLHPQNLVTENGGSHQINTENKC